MTRKTLTWLMIIIALLVYTAVVGSWWIEGNKHFEQDRVQQ